MRSHRPGPKDATTAVMLKDREHCLEAPIHHARTFQHQLAPELLFNIEPVTFTDAEYHSCHFGKIDEELIQQRLQKIPLLLLARPELLLKRRGKGQDCPSSDRFASPPRE